MLYKPQFIQESGHSGYSAYSSGSRSSHRTGRHRSRRQRAREEEEIYTEIRRPRLEAVTEASVEATPVTWRRPQTQEASREVLREKLESVTSSDMRQCDVNDARGHVTSDDDAADPIMTSDLLGLASASPGPLYLNKAELMRLGRARPGRASLVMSPTQQRQEVR